MSKEPVRVVIGRDVQRTVPGMLGRKFDFKAGHAFVTQEWHYPGEPDEQGPLTGSYHDQWSFGSNTGTDLPFSFEEADIREVLISHDPETVGIFERAPFKVTVKEKLR